MLVSFYSSSLSILSSVLAFEFSIMFSTRPGPAEHLAININHFKFLATFFHDFRIVLILSNFFLYLWNDYLYSFLDVLNSENPHFLLGLALQNSGKYEHKFECKNRSHNGSFLASNTLMVELIPPILEMTWRLPLKRTHKYISWRKNQNQYRLRVCAQHHWTR